MIGDMSLERGVPVERGVPIEFHSVSPDFLGKSLPPLKTTAQVTADLKDVKKHIGMKIAINVLSLVAGVALGTFTALAVVGIMVSPIGLGLAGGALLLALAGMAKIGNTQDFMGTLGIALSGFTAGASLWYGIAAIVFPEIASASAVIAAMALSCITVVIGIVSIAELSDYEHIENEKNLGNENLGLRGVDMAEELAMDSELSYLTSAVLITSVESDSVASKAGIRTSDIVIRCNGQEVENLQTLSDKLKSPLWGVDSVPHTDITVLRGGKEIQLEFLHPSKALDLGRIGFSIVPDSTGVLVTHLKQDSVAANAGIRQGDRITEINGTKIENSESEAFGRKLQSFEKHKKDFTIKYTRNGETKEAKFVFQEPPAYSS